jgi:hypothetical protein
MPGTCTLGAVTLPPDIEWEDEGAWLPVSVVDTVTITGAIVRQGSAQQAGRPITLIARGDGHVWLAYSLVETLRAMAASNVATPMTLTLIDGRSFSVLWRHKDTAVEYGPVEYLVSADADVMATRPYTLTLRLMQA